MGQIMLTKIVNSLELDLPIERKRNLKFFNSIETQFKLISPIIFVNNWFNYLNKIPNIGASYNEEIDLSNIYNLALLCNYIERFGIPSGNWFRKSILTVINGNEFSLPDGNLRFYSILKRKIQYNYKGRRSNKTLIKYVYKPLDRNRLLNAAIECGHTKFSGKANFYHRVLEQGLIIRSYGETFKFASSEIAEYIRNVKEDRDFIDSMVASRHNIVDPILNKIINS